MKKANKLFLSLLVLSLVSGHLSVFAEEGDTPTQATVDGDDTGGGNGDDGTGGGNGDDGTGGGNGDDGTGGGNGDDGTGSGNGDDGTGGGNGDDGTGGGNGDDGTGGNDDDDDDDDDDSTGSDNSTGSNGSEGETGSESDDETDSTGNETASEEVEPPLDETPVYPVTPYIPPQTISQRPTAPAVSVTPQTEVEETIVEVDLSLVLEQLLAVPEMVAAYDDYLYIVDNFEFNDELSTELTGSTIEEIQAGFTPEAEMSESEVDGRTVLEYTYGEEARAKISLFFTDGRLSAVVLEDLQPVLTDLMTSEDKQALASSTITFNDVIDMFPNVIGLVHKNFNNQGYDTLIIPGGSEEQLALEFVEVTPNYVVNDVSMSFNPEEDSMSEAISEFINIKRGAADVESEAAEGEEETTEAPEELVFAQQIVGNREFDEAKVISIEEMKGHAENLINLIKENNGIDVAAVQDLLGDPAEINEIGNSTYEYYYAIEDEHVIIINLQYVTSDNTLLNLKVENYTPAINEALPIDIDQLVEIGGSEFDIASLISEFGEANTITYLPIEHQLQYTWISNVDEEMSSISAIDNIASGIIDLFYIPAE